MSLHNLYFFFIALSLTSLTIENAFYAVAYTRYSKNDFSILPFGHIVRADCISESLKDNKFCLYCQVIIYTAPAAVSPSARSNSKETLRGLLLLKIAFLKKTLTGSELNKNYTLFYSLAYSHKRDDDNKSNIVYLVAKRKFEQLELFVISF